MGFGRLNDDQNPAVPLQDHGQGAFQSRESGASDAGQAPSADHNSYVARFMPVPSARPTILSCQNVRGMYQSYPYDPRTVNNVMAGVARPNYFQSPQIDTSFSTFGGGLRKVDAISSGLQSSGVNENAMPIGSNTARWYQNIGEGSNLNWVQATQSPLNLGSDASISHQNTSIVQPAVNSDIKVPAFHSGRVDGSFLTLGIGSNPEARSKRKFDPKEVANKLHEVGPMSNSSFGQPATNAYPNLTNEFSSFNSNLESRTKMMFDHREVTSKLEKAAGTKSSSSPIQPATNVYPDFANDFSSFNRHPFPITSPVNFPQGPHNTGEAMQVDNTDSYFNLCDPEACKRCDILENDCNTTSFQDKSTGRHSAPQFYAYSQAGPSPSSFPLNEAYPYFPQPGDIRPSEFASETSKHTWIPSQPTRDLLGISQSRNTGDGSSPFVNNPSQARGSSVTRDYLGISTFPLKSNATQAAESGSPLTSIRLDGQLSSTNGVHSTHAFGNTNFPEKSCPQIAESSGNRPATGTPFPRRLGVQLNDTSTAAAAATQSLLSMNVGLQNRNNMHQSQNSWSPQASKSHLGPISGNHQAHLPAQSNLQRPSISHGQLQQPLPPQIPIGLPPVMRTPGQVVYQRKAGGPSQVNSHGDQQSLKRKSNEPPAIVSWAQKKRFITIPRDYKVGISVAPSATPHIRWPGFDNPAPPEPIGHRCLICKRDLSFPPEGVESRPANPPPTAVLPCGHTFHDHCLQIITPEGQAHDPPCIPCAIGES